MCESLFPPGTPVSVKQVIKRRGDQIEVQVVGVVESWEDLPTGSWHTFGRSPGKKGTAAAPFGQRLWLKRLKLRKPDGELDLLVIDNSTEIAKLEAKPK